MEQKLNPYIVFTSLKHNDKRVLSFLNSLKSPFLVISTSSHFESEEYTNIFKYKKIVENSNNYWEITNKWIEEWLVNTKIYKKSLYHGYSLFWCNRWPFFKILQEIIVKIDTLLCCFQSIPKESKIFAFYLDKSWLKLLETICQNLNYNLEIVKDSSFTKKQSFIDKLILRGKDRLKEEILKYLLILKGILSFIKLKFKNIDLLFITTTSNWLNVNTSKGIIKEDVILGPIMEEAKKQGIKPFMVTITNERSSGYRVLFEQRGDYIPFEFFEKFIGLFHINKHRILKNVSKDLKNSLESSLKDSSFLESFSYKDIAFSDLILPTISAYFKIHFPFLVKRILVSQIILKIVKPKAVFMVSELGTAFSSLIASLIEKIPTFGIQHAFIHNYHPTYIFDERIERETIPKCNIFFVSGRNTKKLLIEQGYYKEEEIVISGFPRIDRFIESVSKQDSLEIKRRLNLPMDKKIVIFSQQMSNIISAKYIFKEWQMCKDDFYLIVKVHPRETKNDPFESIAKEYNIKEYKAIKNIDLYMLLKMCDIHISVYSTTIAEAALLGKPNLMLDLEGFTDVGDYINQGIAVPISKFSSLKEGLYFLISDDFQKKFKEDQIKFIENNYYKLDGKSSERIVKEIKKLKSICDIKE